MICTYNRAASLGATLECLMHQTFDDFEVIVVNGPSTDDTLAVLAPWRNRVKFSQNQHRNLSISRNLGILASAGDVVAFIDDDALPDADWLVQALPSFNDPDVAGTGGIVFDHTGLALQWPYSAVDRFGWVQTRRDVPYDDQCFPGSFVFPYLQGTNALFRRDCLRAIGGFDETYDFYLDETDVCCRLVDSGWMLRQLPHAAVHHKYLPSAVRDHQRITRDYFAVVKNHTYFCYRHAYGSFPESEILDNVRNFIASRIADTDFHAKAGRIPPESVQQTAATCMEAFAEGLRLGRESVDRVLPPLTGEPPPYLPFATLPTASGRKITIVSSGYTPNMTGGIARLMSDLAPALASHGHDVRVITRAVQHPAVDFEDGVWVHRIATPNPCGGGIAPDSPPETNAFTTAVVDEVRRIETWSNHDLVFGPAWDVEVIGVLRQTALPVAVHIATPVAVAAEMAGFFGTDANAAGPKQLMVLESEVMRTADLFQANTQAVLGTVRNLYGESCDGPRWRVANLGLVDRSRERAAAAGGSRNVLFVGRFESRKGIDTVLHAMERVLPHYDDVELHLIGDDRPLTPGAPLFGASWLRSHGKAEWSKRVRIIGPVDDEQLHSHYAEADIVVLPSRYESFGLAMTEAMMHGRPLVSTRAGGIPEVVRDRVDGLLVEPGSTDETEAAIRELLDDAELASRLGASARSRYLEHFSVDPFASRFEGVLGSVSKAGSDVASIPPGTMLETGERASLSSALGTLTTIVLRALEPSLVTVGSRAPAICLIGERVHRLRLDGVEVPIDLTVTHGRVRYEGATTVTTAAL
ncbi:MAG TPA: glycosyltransferase [Ilumatobacter sp.]|nr:glycosyltransferase [Ilumatobacter sp.]